MEVGPEPTNPGPPANGVDELAPHGDVLAQLLRLAEIVRRRWILVAACVALTLSAAAVVISLLPARYSAEATLVLHLSGPRVLDKVKGVTEDEDARFSGYREYYETQRTILGSRAVAEKALENLGLARDPEFLGIDHLPESEREEAAETIDPIERLREALEIHEVRKSRVVGIAANDRDPERAAAIANAVADAYLGHVRRSRNQLGAEAQSNVSNERDKARRALHAAEDALAEFKRDHSITSISLADRQNVITQNIITLSRLTQEADSTRMALQSVYAQAKRLHKEGNVAGANLLPESERRLFEQLRKEQIDAERDFKKANVEYGEKHTLYRKASAHLNMVNGKIERESADLVAALEARLRAATTTAASHASALEEEQRDALKLSQLEQTYRELEREVSTAEEAYKLVSLRDTEIGMTNRVEGESVEILDRATPPQIPVFPRRSLIFAAALLSGIVLGTVLAASVDLRDQRIRDLPDLERGLQGLGLPVLGQLPILAAEGRGMANARAQRRHRDLHTHLFPQSLMAERCRGVRTAMAFVQGNEAMGTLMITSPSSAEGKSSTAVNLALSYSQAKKRVLLIDADMRRPRLHQLFEPMGSEPEPAGLSAVLSGNATLAEAVLTRAEGMPESLHVLTCGPIPDNPAELLDGAGLRNMLRTARETYDMVVVDSPPVLPVTDPLLIARAVDAVVVMARCQGTRRGELTRSLAQLRHADANVLGVILNQVDARRDSYAYAGGYYGYRASDGNT